MFLKTNKLKRKMEHKQCTHSQKRNDNRIHFFFLLIHRRHVNRSSEVRTTIAATISWFQGFHNHISYNCNLATTTETYCNFYNCETTFSTITSQVMWPRSQWLSALFVTAKQPQFQTKTSTKTTTTNDLFELAYLNLFTAINTCGTVCESSYKQKQFITYP